MVAEVLGAKIRQNDNIKGIVLEAGYGDKGAPLSPWLRLKSDTDNLNAELNELEGFKHFSGLVTNYQKSVALRVRTRTISLQLSPQIISCTD